MVTNYPQQLAATENAHVDTTTGVRSRVASRLTQTLFGLGGHDAVIHFQGNRVMMRCTSCGHDTPGWDVSGRGPRLRFRDASRHRMARCDRSSATTSAGQPDRQPVDAARNENPSSLSRRCVPGQVGAPKSGARPPPERGMGPRERRRCGVRRGEPPSVRLVARRTSRQPGSPARPGRRSLQQSSRILLCCEGRRLPARTARTVCQPLPARRRRSRSSFLLERR